MCKIFNCTVKIGRTNLFNQILDCEFYEPNILTNSTNTFEIYGSNRQFWKRLNL